MFLFAFPLSGLGVVTMIPGVLLISEDSAIQNVLLIGLLVMWAVCSLLGANTYLHMLRFATDKPNARPSFSRRPS
ncbi:hypothetical protein [Nocardia sp. NPDC047654]|uniref:hypothetical protein n=1 Tax=Nocardia sp. NPDC047654 TaxID=3364314 RepID=UPI00371D23BB